MFYIVIHYLNDILEFFSYIERKVVSIICSFIISVYAFCIWEMQLKYIVTEWNFSLKKEIMNKIQI